MEHLGPPLKKVPKQLRNSVAFRPRQEETIPNLIPETEKSKDTVLCSDNRNTVNASEAQCSDTSAEIVEDVRCG